MSNPKQKVRKLEDYEIAMLRATADEHRIHYYDIDGCYGGKISGDDCEWCLSLSSCEILKHLRSKNRRTLVGAYWVVAVDDDEMNLGDFV